MKVFSFIFLLVITGAFIMSGQTDKIDGGNLLGHSDSPYLLKHADNPVHWNEWGDEAIARAKKEGKLIFLSIGYTACHWCNELEKECFTHDDFAEVINERYISIKVDREQRPDLDTIYMSAATAINGRGGWPNNVFLTPDLHPVYAVGYQRRPAFKDILVKVDEYWKNNREKMSINAANNSRLLKQALEKGGEFKKPENLDLARIRGSMDMKYGGFGSSTKFPMTPVLEFLLTEGTDDKFLRLTLDKMANGGLYDHVGGGFHRYSVDPRWEVPHFEKMLYDNALMASLYARASVILDEPDYAKVARGTLRFIERELMNSDSGFLSSLDADSDGEEGKFYTWTLEDIKKITGDDGLTNDYQVTREGNVNDTVFTASGPVNEPTGGNTLRLVSKNRHEDSLAKLFAHRNETRNRPPLDDKVVASWHGLTVSAFARASVLLDDPEFLERAESGADFILDKLQFSHVWRGGKSTGAATLNDLAFSAMSFWDLFEATGSEKYLLAAKKYVDKAKRDFSAGDGGYFLVAKDVGDLIARPRVIADNPLPSSAGTVARVDWRLSVVLEEPERAESSRKTANHLIGALNGANLFSGEAMNLYRETNEPRIEAVYAWEPDEKKKAEWLRASVGRRWGLLRIPLGAVSVSELLTEGRYPAEKTAVYVCLDNICLTPSMSPEEVVTRLREVK